MKLKRTLILLAGMMVFSTGAGALELSRNGRLQKNVDFWVSIYSKYSTREGLIHDAKYVDLVYEVVDVKKPGAILAAKRKWREMLLSVHRKQGSPESLTSEEKKLYLKFVDIHDQNKFLAAAHRKRLRFQLGQKERFLDGLAAAGRYLPPIEQVFKAEGLPVELARLPFVESSFNLDARSKVGASGIWQFMRSTAKLYIRVDDHIDERNDPIRSAEAAAKLLKTNFESLGNWPLAVTAYNHGRKGMMRAVRQVGSNDLEDLVESYKSPTFGFASANFYCELLAAIEVEKNADKYFGKVARTAPLQYFEVKVPDPADLREVSRLMKLDLALVRGLNPALSDAILDGKRPMPAGYMLRLPHDGSVTREAAARVFLAGYARIPATLKQTGKKYGTSSNHVPRRDRRRVGLGQNDLRKKDHSTHSR